MSRKVALRELLVGVEGLALLRGVYEGSDEDASRRLAEIRRLLDEPSFAVVDPTRETDARSGYGAWAATYDGGDNPIIVLEQSVVWGILGRIAPARALDAACGTGRHTQRLVELGHEVLGVDLTPEMLARARETVPRATFLEGDLRALPAADAQFELVVCGLAVGHMGELGPAVAELARVLRPGGRMVVSVLRPFQAMLGWQAPFADLEGRRAFVREHPHSHSEYLEAFAAQRLRVLGCAEPRLAEGLLRSKRRAFAEIPEATIAAYAGLPAVLVWDLAK